MPTTRRAFCAAAFGAATGCLLPACGTAAGPETDASRLTARPATPTGSITPGLTTVGGGAQRDGLLYVPPAYDPATPWPLVLALHGAGGFAEGPVALLTPYADAAGFIVLAVDSRLRTWDAIVDAYGSDVATIDRALAFAFGRCAVRAERLFIEGFSDGATYALGLGLANGDLFAGIVAFSPGFVPRGGARVGRPPVFVSHGTEDTVLPIDLTSRQIVPSLRADGYSVTYQEFVGGHGVPVSIAQAAVTWMLDA